MSKKIERAVPKHPQVYRVFTVDESGTARPMPVYRVRKRANVSGKWTTRVSTFFSFEDAKRCARQPLDPQSLIATPLTFREVMEKFFHCKEFEERRAPGTIHGYRVRARHLKFFEPYRMHEITAKVVDAWVDLMLNPEYAAIQQKSRRDYDHELTLLSVALRYYREFLDDTYVLPIMARHRKRLCPPRKGREPIKYLSSTQEADFLEALERWPLIRDVALFQLHTGSRIGEAAAIEFDSVEFANQQVHIRQHLHWDRTKGGLVTVLKGTKAGPDRTIPLTPECLEMLRRRFQSRSGEIVFEDQRRGDWLTYRSIQEVYDRAFKRIGIPHRGTHCLRHTFAVRFLEQVKDIYAVQKVLGHTDLKMTMRYAKYTNESVKQAFKLFRGGEKSMGAVPNVVPISSGS